MIQRSLRCLFIIPFWFVPLSKRFECLILALTLLVNLVETCLENRSLLMDSMAAQKELGLCVKVKYFSFILCISIQGSKADELKHSQMMIH